MCLWGEVDGGVGMSLGRGEVLPGLTSFWPEGGLSCWCSLAGEGLERFWSEMFYGHADLSH